MKQREEELKVQDRSQKSSKMDAVNEDSEWDDDEDDDDDDSDKSMGLDAQSFRSVIIPKAKTHMFRR